jgi:hypothetical protein
MQNIHGPLEYVSIQDMARATEMCIRLAELSGSSASEPSHIHKQQAPLDETKQVDWVG